jgi:hypothetical protein
MRIVTLLAVAFLVLMPSFASADDTLVKFVGGAASTTMGSYNPVDVLIQSAVEQNKTLFTPLSLRNFGEGWLEPWIPPPRAANGIWCGAAGSTPSTVSSSAKSIQRLPSMRVHRVRATNTWAPQHCSSR